MTAVPTGWPETCMMSPGMEPFNLILLRFLKTKSFGNFKMSDLALSSPQQLFMKELHNLTRLLSFSGSRYKLMVA